MSALNVQVGADVADLQTKLAIAQAELKSTSREVRDFADQMVEASDAAKAELLPQLQAAATASAAAKAEVAGLKAELTELIPEAHEAGGAFLTIRETTEGMNVTLAETKSLFTGLAEVFLVGLGGEKVMELVKSTAELGDSLHKANEETGISVETLSALKAAADYADMSFDILQRGLAKFASNLQGGETTTGKTAEALHLLGITQDELREHSNDSAYMLERVAQALGQYGDGANKQALTTVLFGAKLRDIAPILKDVAENGIEGVTERAREQGVLFDGEFTESAKKAHDSLVVIDHVSQSLKVTLGEQLLPAVEGLARGFELLFGTEEQANAVHTWQINTEIEKAKTNIDELTAKIAANKNTGDDIWSTPVQLQQGQLEDEKQHLADLEQQLQAVRPAAVRLEEAFKDLNIAGGALKVQPIDELKLPDAPSLGEATANKAEAAEAKRIKEQEYQDAIATYQAEAAQYSATSDERIAILGKELATAQTFWGEGSKQYEAIQREMTTAEREQLDQRLKQGQQTMQENTQSFISTREQELAADIEHEQALVTQKKVTVEAAAAEEVKLTDAVYAQLVKRMDLEITMAGDDLALYTKLSNEKIALVQKEQDQIQKINDKAADEEMRKALQTDQEIAKSGAQTGAQLIFGKETVAQAAEQYAELAVEKALEWGLKEVLAHVGFEAQKVTATAVGEQAQVAAKIAGTAEGKAVEAAAGSASVMGDAAKAYAGAYSAVVGIPYIGPILAPIAGGVAYAAVAAYDVFSAEGGIDRVPYDGAPFLLHENETVLSSGPADMLRELVSRGAGSGGDTHNHYSVDMSGSTFGGGTNPSQIEGMVVSALQKAHRKLAFT